MAYKFLDKWLGQYRDGNILLLYFAGYPVKDIAIHYEITVTRVWQIIKEAQRYIRHFGIINL